MALPAHNAHERTPPPTGRVLVGELMDAPDVDPAQLARALAYIRSVNRWLGGTRGLIAHLARWTRNWNRAAPIRLLDVATGSADIPVAAVHWARARGLRLEVTAIDNHDSTLAQARAYVEEKLGEGAGSISLSKLDAREMLGQFGPGAFDFVHAGLFLHHLSDADALGTLMAMNALASRGVVWNDLVRSAWAPLALEAILIGQPHIVRHDAHASVKAGFTRREALAFAEAAGLKNVRYSTIILHRFTLTAEKGGGA
ncbi:MAG: methyltransferase domain-containing protein [Planctomycetota bacterium]|nr:methyltransferase domain-containing protein [Planctomycetota bacterium]